LAGSKVKVSLRYEKTILVQAAGKGQTEIVKLLLNEGIDPSQSDPHGNTALHVAARGNKVDMADLMIAAGLGINVRNNFGQTPLILAVEQGNSQMIMWLLGKKADVAVGDFRGKTALKVALQGKKDEHQAIISMLKKAGAKE
jgi:ankyrin repeat protein